MQAVAPSTNSTIPAAPSQPRIGDGLRHARLVFTGRLGTLDRAHAERLVRENGGRCVELVNQWTTHVVVGLGGWPLLPDGAVSQALVRAEQWQRRRSGIQIWSELQFRQAVGLDQSPGVDGACYDAHTAAQMVGVSAAALERWRQLSVVQPRDGRYDFQDLVALRTLRALLENGVRLASIRAGLQKLADLLPDCRRPLAQLQLIADGSAGLLAQVGDALFEPDGQMRLDFSPAAAPPPVSRLGPTSLDERLARAAELEENADWRGALALYDDAPQQHAREPVLWFNRGNTLRELGRASEAVASFRRALELDPTLSVAWYNLADQLDAVGDLRGALAALQHAVTADPQFADAYFNLAALHEESGAIAEADAAWTAYLSLDPQGPWADVARARRALLTQPTDRAHAR